MDNVVEGVQYMQSLFYKEYLLIYKQKAIKHITDSGELVYSGKDDGLLELESYRYDLKASAKSGKEAYVKEFDDHIDALRYIIIEFKETDRAPVV